MQALILDAKYTVGNANCGNGGVARDRCVGPMIFCDRGKQTEIVETTVWNGIEQMTWNLFFLLNFVPNS